MKWRLDDIPNHHAQPPGHRPYGMGEGGGLISQITMHTLRGTAHTVWGEGGSTDASNCLRTLRMSGAPVRTVPRRVRRAVSW